VFRGRSIELVVVINIVTISLLACVKRNDRQNSGVIQYNFGKWREKLQNIGGHGYHQVSSALGLSVITYAS
jgi:hypothetical protein